MMCRKGFPADPYLTKSALKTQKNKNKSTNPKRGFRLAKSVFVHRKILTSVFSRKTKTKSVKSKHLFSFQKKNSDENLTVSGNSFSLVCLRQHSRVKWMRGGSNYIEQEGLIQGSVHSFKLFSELY